jgi:hypothetical protein
MMPTISSHESEPGAPKLKLLNLAERGDQGAKEMLEMMFPEEAEKLSKDKKKSA